MKSIAERDQYRTLGTIFAHHPGNTTSLVDR